MDGQRCLEGLLGLDFTARELDDAGAKGFITKPYRLTDMVRRVREVLNRRPA